MVAVQSWLGFFCLLELELVVVVVMLKSLVLSTLCGSFLIFSLTLTLQIEPFILERLALIAIV